MATNSVRKHRGEVHWAKTQVIDIRHNFLWILFFVVILYFLQKWFLGHFMDFSTPEDLFTVQADGVHSIHYEMANAMIPFTSSDRAIEWGYSLYNFLKILTGFYAVPLFNILILWNLYDNIGWNTITIGKRWGNDFVDDFLEPWGVPALVLAIVVTIFEAWRLAGTAASEETFTLVFNIFGGWLIVMMVFCGAINLLYEIFKLIRATKNDKDDQQRELEAEVSVDIRNSLDL